VTTRLRRIGDVTQYIDIEHELDRGRSLRGQPDFDVDKPRAMTARVKHTPVVRFVAIEFAQKALSATANRE